MRYLKKLAIPKSWPLYRKKGKRTYVSKPQASLEKSLTVVVVLRDMLNLAKTRKEIKQIIKESEIEVNGKKIETEKYSINLFDVLGIPKMSKYYRLTLTKNGKLTTEEISLQESKKKISKIIGKKVLKDKKIQINLDDGRNFITNEGNVNDSVVVDLKQNKIEKIIKPKEKMNIMIINGKKTGHTGIITNITGEGKNKIFSIKLTKGEVKSSIRDIILLE